MKTLVVSFKKENVLPKFWPGLLAMNDHRGIAPSSKAAASRLRVPILSERLMCCSITEQGAPFKVRPPPADSRQDQSTDL